MAASAIFFFLCSTAGIAAEGVKKAPTKKSVKEPASIKKPADNQAVKVNPALKNKNKAHGDPHVDEKTFTDKDNSRTR